MIFRPKMGKKQPASEKLGFCSKNWQEENCRFVVELEDLAGNRSGIRSCGLLFGWGTFGDPASFIPLNRNFRRNGQFFSSIVGLGSARTALHG